MFVAGFIGSPQMNFINAKVAKRADGIWLEFGKSAVKLPEGRAASLDNSYIGKEVIMGIRPENVHDEESYLSTMPDSIVDADVEITEMMGAETYLYLMIEGTRLLQGLTRARLLSRTIRLRLHSKATRSICLTRIQKWQF